MQREVASGYGASPSLELVKQTSDAGAFRRAKDALLKGDSEWTWLLLVTADYALVVPLFLIMLAAVELAYHFG